VPKGWGRRATGARFALATPTHEKQILGMPVVMAIAGFLIFGLVCAVYNTLAKFLGGIEVEVTTGE